MCRLFGFMSEIAGSAQYPLLDAKNCLMHQASHARISGEIGRFGTHNDGCGIAWQEENSIKLVIRDKDVVWDSGFRDIVSGLVTPGFIAHNRRATGGLRIGSALSHPFSGSVGSTPVAFCHNGTVFSLLPEAKKRGITDSEVFFERLVEKTEELSTSSLSNFLAGCSASLEFSSLNAMILSSDALYVWRYIDDSSPEAAMYDWYYCLSMQVGSGSVTFASEPVDNALDWEPVANRTLISITRQSGEGLAVSTSRF